MEVIIAIFLLLILAIAQVPWVMLALFLWFAGVALIHARQEIRGRLWEYFGRITGNSLVEHFGVFLGTALIVVPALALQVVSAWFAFLGEATGPFWISMLIGARLGDALFSHFLPNAKGYRPNPGYTTAVVYFVDGVAMLAAQHSTSLEALEGFAIGAGFFALVQPVLKATRSV